MTQMKRNQVVDADTGRVYLRYNPMSVEEDYFIPVRGGESTKVESLSGGQFTGDIDDVKYLRDKLFSALKIPPSYLTNSEGASEDKTTLAQKDIRFARTIQRLQRALVSELEKIAVVHLFTRGYRGKDLTSFNIQLNNPSKLAQLQELEHWITKFDVASAATEGFFSKRWISENIFNVSMEEMVRIQREMFHDKRIAAELEKSAEEITAASDDTGGLGGGGLGGDHGGDLGGDLGGDPLGGDLGGDPGAETPTEPAADDASPPAGDEGGGEESALLAAPGKRDVKEENGKKYTTTPKSHGWYEPRSNKGGDRRNMGARKRHLKGQWNDEKKGSSIRSIYPGVEINRFANGVTEGIEASYDKEEQKILKNTVEIQNLIKLLESNQNEA